MCKLLALVVSLALAVALAVPAFGAGTKTKHVKICDCLAFKPHKVKIKQGGKVVWTWPGMLMHNVTVVSGPVMFHSPTKTSGTYSHTFTTKGTYKLECTIHLFKMTVKVS
jgi:plastocyanin